MKKYRHIIEQIAKRDLRIDTLEARGSDRLDFHECSVWQIRRALEYAFIAGMMHAVVPGCEHCRPADDIERSSR